jgi:hypothetical protein
MVPNVSKNGKSFRGAGAYYLHDKAEPGAENDNVPKPTTDNRVAFIDTRNLVNDDPDLAIDEMWATAAMQDALKEAAGIKRGGRKCEDPVKSVSLSWHPSETPTPDQMIEAADKYLKQMGWSEHQALIIGHNDTDHPHVHLLINRVHPETGRTLNDWQDEKRSQAWALDYEKEMGHIWCQKRVEPDLAKDLNVPRPAFEAAREQVENFVAVELSKEALDKRDRDSLKADQKAERVAFFDDGVTAFKELRSEI